MTLDDVITEKYLRHYHNTVVFCWSVLMLYEFRYLYFFWIDPQLNCIRVWMRAVVVQC